jgi:hypothetical protein
VIAFPCLEVVAGELHLAAFEEFTQLLVEEFEVECVNALVIVFAVCVPWCAVTVYEIVIE